MKLFHKSKQPELTDEALAQLLTDAYDARIAGLSDNACRDKHRLSAVSPQAPAQAPVQAFPLGGRWHRASPASPMTDEGGPDTEPTAKKEPSPIRTTPAKKVRWKAAAAAALFLILLGAGGWLLNRTLGPSPAPAATAAPTAPRRAIDAADLKNCHPAELGGETVYVLNDPEGAYDGEFDVQRADNGDDFFQRREDCVSPEAGKHALTMYYQPPEGFSQKTVMSYADYAAYCEAWGLTQTYHDSNQSYLVYTCLLYTWENTRPWLADVVRNEQTVAVFLGKTADTGSDANSSFRKMAQTAWVLTIPMDTPCETVEVYEVMDEAEYLLERAEQERQAKNSLETLPDGTVRIVGYAGYTIMTVSESIGLVPTEFTVNIGGETVCIWIEETELENPDGTPFTNYEIWNHQYPGGGELYQYLCIRAEGCERIEDTGLSGGTDEHPDYRASRLIVCCDPDPEKALEAVRPVFTKTENGSYLSPWGEEYTFLANEGILDCLAVDGERVGVIEGESTPPSYAKPYGFYALVNDEGRDILILYSTSEWYAIYRKASLPQLDISVDNCVRLKLKRNDNMLYGMTTEMEEDPLSDGGLTGSEQIAAFLADVRSQQDPRTAGLYDRITKPDGSLENCYLYGVIYGFFADEPNLAVPMIVISYNDQAYSVSIRNEKYVLPQEWFDKLIEASDLKAKYNMWQPPTP